MKRIRPIKKYLMSILCMITAVGSIGCTGNNEVAYASMISSMSIREKIGQLVLVNFRKWKTGDIDEPVGLEIMNDEIADIIAEYHIGNVILFGENTRDSVKTAQLVIDLQNAAISSGNLPLLIGIDQEGGIVTRLAQGTCLPGNMAIGNTSKTKYAYQAGKILGSELSALGVNCDFAPVADVNDNPNNPVIGLRSFGSKPKLVAQMVLSTIDGLRDEGIIACAKHFPGHGNTSTDTHTGLAIVNKSKDEWLNCEQIPFNAAIDDGIDMIMTAHIQYPNLDNTQIKSQKDDSTIFLPATLSKKIITGVLREEMGFDGVVVTDALDMQAITDHFGREEAAVMALNAGADLLCNPTEMSSLADIEQLENVYSAIEAAVASGSLSMERIDEAVKHVLALKNKYGILNTEQYNVSSANEQAIRSIVGGEAHRNAERELTRQTIASICDSTFKPFAPTTNDTLLVVMPKASQINSVEYAISRLQKENKIGVFNVNYICYENGEEATPGITEQIKEAIPESNYVILGSELIGSHAQDKLYWANAIPDEIISYLREHDRTSTTAVFCTGLPYQLERYADIPCFICYCSYGMSAADAESGEITSKYIPNIPAAVEQALLDGPVFSAFNLQ